MKRSSLFFLAASGVALFSAACVFFTPRTEPVVPGRVGIFPHVLHADGDASLDCVDCHDMAESESFAGMPTLNVCRTCHDEAAEADKDLSHQLAGFLLPGNEEATWSSVTKASIEVNFSHAKHYAAEVDCQSCHVDVIEADEVSWDWKVSMDSCISCHEAQRVSPLECQQCHEGLDMEHPPVNHGDQWQQVHGMVATIDDLHSPMPSRDCSLCHTQEGCDACHRVTKPQSHTEPWRTRGHGIAAFDRESCATCHSESSCVQCHKTAVPTNHSGIWGGATSAHCISCHLPLDEGDGCAACHQATPSHNAAPARLGLPHPGPSSDCRSCHAPLDHLDNGQACTTCHH